MISNQSDTLYITDSLSCKYILVDRFVSQKDTLPSIESLWGHHTLINSASSIHSGEADSVRSSDYVLSAIILTFFILLVIFSREVRKVLPATLNSLFKLSNHLKLENKLSLSNQRDIVTVIAALYFPIFITLLNSDRLIDNSQLQPKYFLLLSLAFIAGFWLLRKSLYSTLSWLTKDKNTFKLIEKIGYNHLIISVIFSFPIILLTFIWPQISDVFVFNVLICSTLFIFAVNLYRGYQIIISHRYSHFFYILYLCGIELLPIALLLNFILSY